MTLARREISKLYPSVTGSVKTEESGFPSGNSRIQYSMVGQSLGMFELEIATVTDSELRIVIDVALAISSQEKSGVQSMTSI